MNKRMNKKVDILCHSEREKFFYLFLSLVLGFTSLLICWLVSDSGYQGNVFGHSLLEITGSFFALLAGGVFIKYSALLESRFFLFVGLGLLINGMTDFLYAILLFNYADLSSHLSSSMENFAMSIHMAGRIMLAVLLIIAVFLGKDFGNNQKPKKETLSFLLPAFFVTVILTFGLFFSNLSHLINVNIITFQLTHLIVGVLFFIALIFFLIDYVNSRHILRYWITLSVLIGFISQIVLTYSETVFDIYFDLGHLYKTIGYLIPLTGFVLYQMKYIVNIADQEKPPSSTEDDLDKVKSDLQNSLFKLIDSESSIKSRSKNIIDEQLTDYFSRLVQAAESAGLAVWELDVSKDEIIANNQWNIMFGLQEGKVLKTDWLQNMHAEDIDKNIKALENHLKGKSDFYDDEFRYVNSALNKQFWFRIRGKVVEEDENKNPLKVLGICLDVTDRKKRELDELKEEKKFHNLYDNSPDMHGSVRVDTGELYECNETLLKELGYKREEIVGHSIFNIYDDSIMDKVKKAFAGFVQTGVVRDAELRLKRKDGSSFDVGLNVNAIKDEQGKILYSTSTWRDITHKKETEKKLKELVSKLEESNKDLEQFAYVASHDLQEPLRMVASYTELLSRRYADKLDEDGRDFINFAVDGSRRMKKLIDDLLEYSRVSTRAQEFKVVNVEKLIEEILLMLKPEIDEKKAAVVIEDMPELKAAELHLSRVFSNLISNALKFNNSNDVRVDISVSEDKDYYKFSVKDNGIGIDSKYHDRIFQIFQRLNSKAEYSGTGIGLAVCKKIVEKHKGKIWVESELNKGTTFHFTIKRF